MNQINDRDRIVCQSKKRYPDELTARANVSILCEQYNKEYQSVYYCNICRGWHCSSDGMNKSRKYRVSKDDTFVRADRTIRNNHGNHNRKFRTDNTTTSVYVSATNGDDILKEINDIKKLPTFPIKLIDVPVNTI